MEHGSYFGDGAQRGPDYTAEALHQVTIYMNEYRVQKYIDENGKEPSEMEKKVIGEKVKSDLKENRYQKDQNIVILSDAQAYALMKLRSYYTDYFIDNNKDDAFPPSGYIADRQEVADLSDFFFWGAWVCAVKRPGTAFSFTHNWPYDPAAGNTPTSPVILWSVLGLLAFVIACGVVLYFIGQYNQLPNRFFKEGSSGMLTTDHVNKFKPTKTQKASFKFFFVAILLFLIQVLSGVWTINEFVDFLGFFGIHTSGALPITVTRSWHLMIALYWISTCWIASSIFILPILSKKEIPGQLAMINTLFIMLFILVGGSLTGMILGPLGLLGDWWYWLGHQGWEFVDFGKAYQVLLMACFILWAVIIYRGLKPAFQKGKPWNLPKWIMYSVIGIPLLFLSGFIPSWSYSIQGNFRSWILVWAIKQIYYRICI